MIEVQPEPGVEMADDEPLMIVFDQQMHPLTVGLRTIITGRSDLGECTHAPLLPEDEIWPPNNRYSITVTGAAANGLKLEPAYEIEVQSSRSLSVAAVMPEDGTEGVATESAQIAVTPKIMYQ